MSYLLPCPTMKFAPARCIDHTDPAEGDCFHPNVCSSCAPLWDTKNIIGTKVVALHSSEVQCNGNLKIYPYFKTHKLPFQW